MDSLRVAAGVVLPMMLLMAVGFGSRVSGIATREAMRQFDQLLFRLFLPMLLFRSIYTASTGIPDAKAVAFCYITLSVIFLVSMRYIPRYVPDGGKAASLIQSLGRANFTLYALAIVGWIYGDEGKAVAAMICSVVVPFTSAWSVVVLETNRSGSANVGKIVISVLKNPMIVSSALGYIFRFGHIPIPGPVWGVVTDIAGVATTVSFISLGAGLDLMEMHSNRKLIRLGTMLRMVVIPLICIPLAAVLGFRGPVLCVLMVLYVSPAAINSYPMAVAMGADGPLAGQLVCVTTVVSLATVFVSTFILHGLALI